MIGLRGGPAMPDAVFYLDVTERDTAAAVNTAVRDGSQIFLTALRPPVDGSDTGYEQMGVIAGVRQAVRVQNKELKVRIETFKRARLLSVRKGAYMTCTVCDVTEVNDMTEAEETAMVSILKDHLKEAFQGELVKNKVMYTEVKAISKAAKLTDVMADYLKLSDEDRQEILNETDVRSRALRLVEMTEAALSINRIKAELMSKVNNEVSKEQRRYVLREQMAVIKNELGENGTDGSADQYERELLESGCPDEVRRRLEKEISYYRSIPQSAAESSVSANYIETLLSYPWNISTPDNDDIEAAIDILDKDHYGLKEVKERIIDYLAVNIFSSKGNMPIICLVGPPGTGKTSIARSIARATSRKYVRMSLGGVRDEAEIRGHRKTYVGAMPGRIVQAMIKARTNNPLMLLDEIDKVSSDYRGDVSSALLEVLDSEQNREFDDRYFGVPVDLSRVLFVATANDLSDIPGPLLDRMEIINIPGYTENEKYHIARLYLLDKTREKNGLGKSQLKMDAGAIREIIRYYTREAGVRDLERNIDKVCRKTCRTLLMDKDEQVKVTKKNVEDFLGPRKYKDEAGSLKNKTGAVRGLAWTAVGGVTLEIEVNVLPGNGALILTGKMGDVMKESAQAGLSYIRSMKESAALGDDFFSKHDIHIHIPEGAVPKDGPSAGITMATAMYSAIFGIPVDGRLAMTGEITLRGEVLPIGGLKEKLLAAKMVGARRVLIPEANMSDYQQLEAEITSNVAALSVENMRQVLEYALVR